MDRVQLSRDAFMCMVDGHAVFLDLRSDRYLALPPSSANLLQLILGTAEPTPEGGKSAPTDWKESSEAETLRAQLEAEGLLTKERDNSRDAVPASSLRVQSSALSQQHECLHLNWGAITGIAIASASSLSMLKILPLKSLIAHVQRRKSGNTHHGDDLEEHLQLAHMYQEMRSLVVRKRRTCLQDSLMLIEFFARYCLYPDWVFGVRISPFAAHCWVQYGSTALNDYTERVSAYTPIMVV